MKRIGKILGGLLLVLLVVAGGFVALSWAPDRPVESLKARWAAAPSQFIEVEGLQVHLRDQGPRDAPVLVLLHGTSASLHTWEGWVEGLPQYRVISLDLPAFGLTGPFADQDYTLAHYSRFLSTLLDQLQVSRASFAGNSFGGELAWRFAVDQPQRVERLILVDAAGYPRQSTSVPLGFRLAGSPALKPIMANLLPRSLIESSVRSVYGDPQKVTPELIDRYYELALREGNRQALRQRFAQYSIGADPSRIAGIKAPTLIIWGGRDGLISPQNAKRFHADIADSQLEVFPDLGHVPQEEDPARTLAVALKFLQGDAPTH
jgi:pimeloyl-ACP methyl ester carboxylesterase